jgi:hypothetical protein
MGEFPFPLSTRLITSYFPLRDELKLLQVITWQLCSSVKPTLQIRSNTDWSGSYGDSTGSTTVDGHGNKDFVFSCSNTYSAIFQKKGEGQGFLTLNIVQPFNNTVTKFQDTTKHGVPLLVG